MILARDLERALDARALLEEVSVTPDPWQQEMLTSPAKRSLYLCCRQSGKSTTAAAKALHTAMFNEGELVLLLSPSLRQSGELFRKVLDLYRQLEAVPDPEAQSALRLELPNGSRIVSLPGSDTTIRGYSDPGLVVIDEAAHCSDVFLQAVLPMLASGRGSLLALSTPCGARGWYWQAWTKDESWQKTLITWEQCPRISQEAVDLYRATAGELMYQQEFLCHFVDAENVSIIPAEVFDGAFDEAVPVIRI